MRKTITKKLISAALVALLLATTMTLAHNWSRFCSRKLR